MTKKAKEIFLAIMLGILMVGFVSKIQIGNNVKKLAIDPPNEGKYAITQSM